MRTVLVIGLALLFPQHVSADCEDVAFSGFILDADERSEICRLEAEIRMLSPNAEASSFREALSSIESARVHDVVRSYLRRRVRETLEMASEGRLVSLALDSDPDVGSLAIAALDSESLSLASAEVLRGVALDSLAADDLRSGALWKLGLYREDFFSKEELYSFVSDDFGGVSATALYFFLRPRCEEDFEEPTKELAQAIRTWLHDSKQSVRFEAAICVLDSGVLDWYETSHPLVKKSIRILGARMLDNRENPVVRGRAIESLTGWTESSLARRYLKKMFRPSRWFFGARGHHWPVHSLVVLHGLAGDSEWEWPDRQFALIAEDPNRLLDEEGGRFVLWKIADDGTDFFGGGLPYTQGVP